MKLSLRKTAEVVGCVTSTVLNELRRGTGTRNGNRDRFSEYSAKRDRLIMKSTALDVTETVALILTALSFLDG